MIKHYRESNNLSQQDLAAKVSVSQATIADWERGTTAPKRSRLPTVANALGIDVSMLIQALNNPDFDLAEASLEQERNRKMSASYQDIPFLSVKAQVNVSELDCSLEGVEETFPVYLPGLDVKKQNLVVEMNGNSMEPGIRDRARLLAELVNPDDYVYEPSGIYAVMYANRFVVKRVINNDLSDGKLQLHSDNERHGIITVLAKDIRCIWRITGKIWEPVD